MNFQQQRTILPLWCMAQFRGQHVDYHSPESRWFLEPGEFSDFIFSAGVSVDLRGPQEAVSIGDVSTYGYLKHHGWAAIQNRSFHCFMLS